MLRPRASAAAVHEALHGRIVRGELRPGEMLAESRVAAQFGLSRTPVRAVFWRLAEEGLLRVIPQVGTFVAPISIPSVYDAQFIRETLECRAIADAATLSRAPGIAALRALLAEQRATLGAGDFAAFFTLDERMHRQLMEMAGRPFVWPVITGVKAQLDRVRFLSLEQGSWPAMILAQHEEIIARVAAHDAAGAAEVMRAHLRTAFAAIERIAAEHPDFFEGAPSGA
jgi:DNA-binding GntR family transcriptional regulator